MLHRTDNCYSTKKNANTEGLWEAIEQEICSNRIFVVFAFTGEGNIESSDLKITLKGQFTTFCICLTDCTD